MKHHITLCILLILSFTLRNIASGSGYLRLENENLESGSGNLRLENENLKLGNGNLESESGNLKLGSSGNDFLMPESHYLTPESIHIHQINHYINPMS